VFARKEALNATFEDLRHDLLKILSLGSQKIASLTQSR
jgi:hypothetical protein